TQDRLISELELDLYEVTESEIEEALENVYEGAVILDLIRKGIPQPEGALGENEFGAPKTNLERSTSGTWTLVVLSDLKPTGRELKIGVLRRMLEAALPFGSEMAISLNGELLTSSKIDLPLIAEWVIGPALGIDSIELDEEEVESGKSKLTKLPITSGTSPASHVTLPEVGQVTGRVRLFADSISGGKSEERGSSNGFHVNVLG